MIESRWIGYRRREDPRRRRVGTRPRLRRGPRSVRMRVADARHGRAFVVDFAQRRQHVDIEVGSVGHRIVGVVIIIITVTVESVRIIGKVDGWAQAAVVLELG